MSLDIHVEMGSRQAGFESGVGKRAGMEVELCESAVSGQMCY